VHLLLTDRLVCPRCGPGFGLILRADDLRDRWVRSGGLGCPNCREIYPVTDGVGDLRPPPRDPVASAEPAPTPGDEAVFRAQALLGLEGGAGELLLIDQAARYAEGLARRLPELRVVAAGPGPEGPAAPEPPGWSRIRVGTPLPFDPRSLRGVLVEGPVSRAILREAARVVGSGGRVVVQDGDPTSGDVLMASGLTVRLQEAGVVVAGR
jgi:uncharacterized protein YbaR (Trm112 family)